MSKVEIERRWFFKPFPKFKEIVEKGNILNEEVYLYSDDNNRNTICRFRRLGKDSFITIKCKNPKNKNHKIENEIKITNEEFENYTKDLYKTKTWYYKDSEGYEYKPTNVEEDVWLMEKEFVSKEKADSFVPDVSTKGIIIEEIFYNSKNKDNQRRIIDIYVEEKKRK